MRCRELTHTHTHTQGLFVMSTALDMSLLDAERVLNSTSTTLIYKCLLPIRRSTWPKSFAGTT